jgi:hypothetical protein
MLFSGCLLLGKLLISHTLNSITGQNWILANDLKIREKFSFRVSPVAIEAELSN